MSPRTRSPWLKRTERPAARVKLFCLPFAGGGASAYAGWAKKLPVEIEMNAIQLPGRENRIQETAYRSAAELVADLVDALGDEIDRPYCLYGHSMGALLAFELAREFVGRGKPPAHLFAAVHRAPHLLDPEPPTFEFSDDELKAFLHKSAGTPWDVMNDRLFDRFSLPMIRADFELCDRYRFEPSGDPLPCGITAFSGSADDTVDHEELLAWGEHGADGVTLSEVEGDHFFVREAPPELMAEIGRTCLVASGVG